MFLVISRFHCRIWVLQRILLKLYIFSKKGDGYTFNITLHESQRALAIANSGTSGGDSTPLILDAGAGGFVDIAKNPSLLQSAIVLNEVPDLFPPLVLYAEIHFGLFYVKFTATEFIDSTPRSQVNLSNIFIFKCYR